MSLIKKYFSFLLLLTFLTAHSTSVITITGTQTIDEKTFNKSLKCKPVRIAKEMTILKVEGDCQGFWIVKKDQTIHDFSRNKSAIGTVLKKGTYYVYPHLKENRIVASVTMSLH